MTMKFIRSSSTAQSWAPDGVPQPAVLSHCANAASAAVPVSWRSPDGNMPPGSGGTSRRRSNVSLAVTSCMIDSVSAVSQASSRTLQRSSVSPSSAWRASSVRKVANDVVLDQLLQGVADRGVECGRDGRLQAALLVRNGQVLA